MNLEWKRFLELKNIAMISTTRSKKRYGTRYHIPPITKEKFDIIIEEACLLFGTSKDGFYSNYKTREVADARKAVTYVSVFFLQISQAYLSKQYDQDHSTIAVQLEAAKQLVKTDFDFDNNINSIIKKIAQ